MHNGILVLGCNFYGSMRSRGGCSTYQYGDVFTCLFKFFYQVHHFIKRGCNQSRQAYGIHLLGKGCLNNALWRYHNSHINDFVVITTQDHSHNIFANIVHIPFNGCHQYFPSSFRFTFLGCFNVGQ